jgi:hypothetical protein
VSRNVVGASVGVQGSGLAFEGRTSSATVVAGVSA